MKNKKKAGLKKRNSHKVQSLQVSSKSNESNDSQKLKQLEQQQSKQQQLNQPAQQNKQSQHHKNNILLIVVVVLILIAVLFVFNLNAAQREKAALKQQEQQSDYIPYEDIVEQQQKAESQAVPDVPKETILPAVISEEQLVKQQVQKSGIGSLESQLSLDYDLYFLGGCKDSDGGKNFYEQGTTMSKTGSSELDLCSTAKQYPNRLYEFYCDKNEMARKMVFECPNGCKDGVCIAAK